MARLRFPRDPRKENPTCLSCTAASAKPLTLRFPDDIDPATPIGEILGDADIIVELKWLGETSASIGIEAPRAIKVLRTELLEGDEAA